MLLTYDVRMGLYFVCRDLVEFDGAGAPRAERQDLATLESTVPPEFKT
jgi:hypothetical protein